MGGTEWEEPLERGNESCLRKRDRDSLEDEGRAKKTQLKIINIKINKQ